MGSGGVSASPGGESVNGLTISGSIISLPRACALCGRGGNLHLSAADPNCRCQQDSVLVASLQGGVGLEDSKLSPEVDVEYNIHKNQASGKQKKAKIVQQQLQRKSTSVTPIRLGMVSITDGGEPHPPNTEEAVEKNYASLKSIRPLSASTIDQCLVPSPHRPNVHHRKLLRKSAMASMSSVSAHPPDNGFNPRQNFFHSQHHLHSPSIRHKQNLQGFTSSWQALASSSGAPSSIQELIYSPLHPLFYQHQRHMLVHPTSYRPMRTGYQKSFTGCMHAGARITSNAGGGSREYHTTQKSSPSMASSGKFWTNIGLADGYEQRWSPLSVVAHRRAQLKQPK
ncbi:hypothetical protein RRG08_035630 [Elysia crispata]|uniref:Uncharacterized protein n=1 Tax=Elysia crispata TaxID=231223 RepID=A0AAE0YAD3_9GAST|nr:hypothetical protein RRG08_035630 [Elysia crispata]